METPCSYCGQPMRNRERSRAKFCSIECKDKARNEARRTARIEARPQRQCVYCGGVIDPAKPANTLACSFECNWKHQNRTHAAARTADRRARRSGCARCGDPIPSNTQAATRYCSTACHKAALAASWHVKSPGYMRQYMYGITPEDYVALLESQGGRCAICRTDQPNGKGFHLDHDHATGAVRGILCGSCNNGLGRFKDDPARLQAAIAYLA